MKKLLIVLLLLALSVPCLAKNEDKQKNYKTLPPGLQKKYERTGELPPGWQKKLVKGQVLDPDLYSMAQKYPLDPVQFHLKPQKGTELIRLEDRIIRIVNDTKVVLDVFGVDIN